MSRRNCLPSWSPNVMILVLLIAALKNAIDRYRVDNAISSNVNVVSEDDLNVEWETSARMCQNMRLCVLIKHELTVLSMTFEYSA